MLSLHTKRKRMLTAVLSTAVILPVTILAACNLMKTNGVFAVDYPMPAGFNDQVFYNCIVGQFKSQFPSEVIPDTGLTDEQLAMMTTLNCNGESYATKITDTSGLEKMTGLTYLNVSNNEISSINLSSLLDLRNLQVGKNAISTLDISNNTELRTLAADYNNLTEINVANRVNLRELDVKHNQMSSIDVSNDSNLTTLVVDYNTISTLNTTNATALTTLKAYNNNLSSLDLSTNTNLTHLQVDYNQFTELDLTGSTKLVELRAESNPLTSLNVAGLTNLGNLYVAYNYLSSLDLSTNTGLINVEVYSNGLSGLNLANSTELATLKAQSNMLSSLVLPETDTLTLIDVSNNQLSAIDVSKNPSLTSLAVQNNQLSSLDVSNNLSLTSLTMQTNSSVTSMDISGNTSLTTFRVDNVPVTTNLALSSVGETTSFSLSGLKFIKTTQSIPDTDNYTYSSSTKTLTMTNGYSNLAQITATPSGMTYKLVLPMYLAYDANGGSDAPDAEICYPEGSSSDCSYTVPDTEPTKDDNYFLGWSTDASATTASYAAGDTFTAEGYATLYAVWSPVRTLSYDMNGGEGEIADQTCYNSTDASGSCSITISTTEPTYNNHVFLGWSTDASATTASYAAGGSITITDDTTLHAVWSPVRTLSYDMNGGEGEIADQTCYNSTDASGSCSITISTTEPTYNNHVFLGWSTDASAATGEYQPGGSITISSDTTLKALWGVKYSLSYDVNGGVGSFETQTCQATTATATTCKVQIYASEPTKAEEEFFGWGESSDAKVIKYRPSAEVTLSEDTTIYAVWGEGGVDWDKQDYIKGESDSIVMKPVYPLSMLEGVLMDDEEIPASQYIIDSDNNTVTLKDTYLDTLAGGGHAVKFTFTGDLVADTNIIIVAHEGGDEPSPEDDPSAEPATDDEGNVILDFNTPKIPVASLTINIYDENGQLVKTIEISDPSSNVRIDVSDLPNGNYTAELIHKDKDGNVILVTTESIVKDDNTDKVSLSVETKVDVTKQITVEIFDEDGNLVRTIKIDAETGKVEVYDKDGNLINTIENGYVDGKLVLPMDGLDAGIYNLKVSYLDKDGRVVGTVIVEGIEYGGDEEPLPVPNTGGLFHHSPAGIACDIVAVVVFVVIAATGVTIIRRII